jgi:hypothetical protein
VKKAKQTLTNRRYETKTTQVLRQIVNLQTRFLSINREQRDLAVKSAVFLLARKQLTSAKHPILEVAAMPRQHGRR